jgi:hypothetical protein
VKGAFALAAGCWLMLAAAPPEPSDGALIRLFRTHRADFETVRRMALAEHGIGRIAPDFIQSANGTMHPIALADRPSAARMRRYRALFRRIGAAGGIGFSRTRVYFYIYDAGLAGQGTSKAIVWTTDTLKPLRPDLDSPRDAVRPVSGFRHITPGWYLEYEAE